MVWFPGDWRLPQLNPYSSRSHSEKSGKPTRTLHEPLWLFRLRMRVFCFAGRHRCASRGQSWVGMHGDGLEPDTWDRGPDGFRTCSYCGSLHHDDFVEICGRTLIDERYSVERSTKSYKFYVRQPGVRNAGEGAIKFYTHHCPDVIPDQQQETFGEAIRLSHRRFQERMQRQYAV